MSPRGGVHFSNLCEVRVGKSLRGTSHERRPQANDAHKVIFPSISRHTSTSGLSRIARVTANISRPRACAHQLPRIGSPVIAATSDGTGPGPDSSTNPCVDIKASASAGFTMNIYCSISTRIASCLPWTARIVILALFGLRRAQSNASHHISWRLAQKWLGRITTGATWLARRLYSFCIPRVNGENPMLRRSNSRSSTRSESGGYVCHLIV